MWILYAFASAFFAGITSILAKCGIKETDSNVATAIRTTIVLVFSWTMVFVVGSQQQIANIEMKTLLFLVLSGLATGASWLCYFKALQLGDVNKVAPIDKSSTVITMILAFLFLGEEITWMKGICIVLIGVGTFLMVQKKQGVMQQKISKRWFIYAVLAAVFASMTAILGKVGINEIESNLGTAIRTIIVFFMAWAIVFMMRKQNVIHRINQREIFFIIFSGIATGASWLCYYKALKEGIASIVVPIDKLSILVTIVFSFFVLKEKLIPKAVIGLVMIVAGTMLLLVPL